MRTHAARRSLAVLVAFVVAAGPARAQIYLPPPPSTLIDTSIRGAAMGGAGAAVTWGEPGVWANPATLAHVSGVGWVTGHTLVLPGLSSEVTFDSQRLLIGGGGLGFSFMGQPISGLGKARLAYGTTTVTDPFGNPIGTFSAHDQTEGWGIGLSPLRLIESIRKLANASPRSLTSYGDVTVGYQGKASKAIQDPGLKLDEAGTYDWGASGRLALARFWGADAPFRLDLSGAYSQLNLLRADEKNSSGTTQQIDRVGAALHLSPPPPSERSSSPPSLPWWRPGDVPEISMGLAYDHEHRHDEPFAGNDYDVDHYGLEANLFRLLSVRVGYVSDREGQIEGWTYGGGLSIPIGPWGSVGYQLASVPLAPDLDRQFRQGWSVWLDPTRFWSENH